MGPGNIQKFVGPLVSFLSQLPAPQGWDILWFCNLLIFSVVFVSLLGSSGFPAHLHLELAELPVAFIFLAPPYSPYRHPPTRLWHALLLLALVPTLCLTRVAGGTSISSPPPFFFFEPTVAALF